MKLLVLTSAIVFLLGSVLSPSFGQEKHLTAAPLDGSRPVSLSAVSIERGTHYPTIVHLKGKVEIKTPICLPVGKHGASVCDGETLVRADEADFHEDTGEILAHGNVQITPLHHGKR